jgi:alkanesulfonate monooxygenase SsuD/methylene tetrahydromethanopterin reductase-like flavin-dependent oxidoreductase (luciferase family)
MVTPLARRRPQIVARQIAALDQLSRGRAVLGVGLGLDASGEEFVRFGEETDVRARASMFDEALDLVSALLSGEPVDHHGRHYTAAEVQFLPAPPRGRLPIWVAARWPNRAPLRRAARHDGVFVIDLEPRQLPEAVAALQAEGTREPFEIVVHDGPQAEPGPWADAGASWLLTTFAPFGAEPDDLRRVIRQGPAN